MPVTVELEKDLSLKQQLLDVVVIRKDPTPLACRMPDGFEDLAAHNLISFKSYQEAMDGWAINELIGHYVNYRKQISPSMQNLLPETDFRVFAVSVRFPQGLARRVQLTPVRPGVYEIQHFTGLIRLIVVHELPQEEHNAMLHLFSDRFESVRYGTTHHELRSDEASTLLLRLFERYRLEETFMPDLLERLKQETLDELFAKMAPEEVLKRFPHEKLLKGMSIEERLKGVPTEDLLSALPPEIQEKLTQQLKGNDLPPKPDSK